MEHSSGTYSLISLIVRILISVYCVNKAGELNKDKTGWGFFGFLLPIIAIIWIQFVKPNEAKKNHFVQFVQSEQTVQSESILIDNNYIDFYITQYGSRFPIEKINEIRHTLEKCDSKKKLALSMTVPISPYKLLIISILFGIIGVDRFLTDEILFGIIKLLSLGGFGTIFIYDIYTAKQRAMKFNFKNFVSITQSK